MAQDSYTLVRIQQSITNANIWTALRLRAVNLLASRTDRLTARYVSSLHISDSNNCTQ